VGSAVASRRGQMLGMAGKDGWSHWDMIEALIPEAELHGLEAELRSLTQGMGQYEARFERFAELSSKLTGEVIKQRATMA
jgi:elongation factor G